MALYALQTAYAPVGWAALTRRLAFGWSQVRLTRDQQSVDNTARGDGNAEGRQR